MPIYRFSLRSLDNLSGVHPELILIASRALLYSEIDFIVTEGLRTADRQQQLFADGKSQTLNSKHLTGDAIDVAAYVDGRVSWDFGDYIKIADAFKRAASELGLSIEWGGDWRAFKDGPHFQRGRA